MPKFVSKYPSYSVFIRVPHVTTSEVGERTVHPGRMVQFEDYELTISENDTEALDKLRSLPEYGSEYMEEGVDAPVAKRGPGRPSKEKGV
jgi:hypothetical protein